VTRHSSKTVTTEKGTRKPSQGRMAALLGVGREHLNRVLNGKRTSRRLMQRYQELRGRTE